MYGTRSSQVISDLHRPRDGVPRAPARLARAILSGNRM